MNSRHMTLLTVTSAFTFRFESECDFKMWLLLLLILPVHIRERRSVKVAAFLIVVGTLVFWWFNFPFQKFFLMFHNQDNRKTVLIWNPSQSADQDIFSQRCDFAQCNIITNRSELPLESYDAIVVIFNDEFSEEMELPEFGSERNPRQRLVFFTQNPPPAFPLNYNKTQFENLFNWTMTYRMDSDISFPFGRIIPKESAPRNQREFLASKARNGKRLLPAVGNKTKTIAWMASDCNATSQQGNYVKELSRYVAVDVYGECGNVTCDPQCDDMLQSMYKFHLSFENSLCPDYVTEKFFQMMNHDIVPVVYGEADYSQHAPPYSYIDARKFEPNELATYLNLLDKNDTLYNEYFWWKDYYRVESSVKETYRRGFCDLCQKLNQRIEFKSYPELASSWGDECTPSV